MATASELEHSAPAQKRTRPPYLRAGLLFATGLLGFSNFFQNAGNSLSAGGDTVMVLVSVYGMTGLASAVAVLRRWRWGRVTLVLWAISLVAAATVAPQVFSSGDVTWTASVISAAVAVALAAAGVSAIGVCRE